ncbi:MAG: FkbM family methyltransferase [Microcystaceae cyanobacterium]
MRVEACCQSLLCHLLPEIDPGRSGVCIDVGVGTFAFYCEIFARLGFPTVAIEPLPVKKLYQISKKHSIQLIESCLSDQTGEQDLYLGNFAGLLNRNFSSLSPDWFGSSQRVKRVKSLTLPMLLDTLQVEKITILKLDIEGWEYNIIKQLPDLKKSQLPRLIMFEYGGGVNKNQGQKGWSKDFFEKTLRCLTILKDCGYGSSLMLDFVPQSQETLFDLRSPTFQADHLFKQQAIYGNIISCLDWELDADTVRKLCQPFYAVNFLEWFVSQLVSG